jgi:hypothetical protein
MLKSVWQYLMCIIAAATLSGCGGGGGLGLSGGSIPVGGRVVTGTALLPDGSAAANAQVSVKTIQTGATVATAMTDAAGKFAAQNVPTNGDVSVVVTLPPTGTLQSVVSTTDLMTNPSQPLDIGNVTALTTLVAACIQLEQSPAPEDGPDIVMNQHEHLSKQVHDAGFSVDAQNQFIADPSSLTAQALTLIVPTANNELAAFAANPNQKTARAALDGLLAYVRAAHERRLHISKDNRAAIISSELAGTTYTPQKVAAALRSAGVKNVNQVQVTAASERERTELPGLGSPTSDLSAFEALVIAADVNTHGGFELDQRGFNTFLSALLN